jgi:hypothetical protein
MPDTAAKAVCLARRKGASASADALLLAPSTAPTRKRGAHQQEGDDNQYSVHSYPSVRELVAFLNDARAGEDGAA